MLMKGMLMLPSNLDPKLHHPKSDPKPSREGGRVGHKIVSDAGGCRHVAQLKQHVLR